MFSLISKLLDIEDDFIVSMRAGVERFSIPLKRHESSSLSPTIPSLDNKQHATIFQNIEQVWKISTN